MGYALTRDRVVAKCHIGEGARCCKYLMAALQGFECAATNVTERESIDARAASFTAKSGPCADPSDATSEARAYEPP